MEIISVLKKLWEWVLLKALQLHSLSKSLHDFLPGWDKEFMVYTTLVHLEILLIFRHNVRYTCMQLHFAGKIHSAVIYT